VPLRYVRELTAQERAALTELYETSSAVEVAHRSHAILLSAGGWRVTKVAELLRIDQSTVHRWLDRFGATGLAGLARRWSEGWGRAADALQGWRRCREVM
jgi:transposase